MQNFPFSEWRCDMIDFYQYHFSWIESLLCVSGKLCHTWGQAAAGRRGHQRPGCSRHLTAGGDFTKPASFLGVVQTAASSSRVSTQIPDIIRVGAKRYFGQTAMGGPFHVILWAETITESKVTQCGLRHLVLISLLAFFLPVSATPAWWCCCACSGSARCRARPWWWRSAWSWAGATSCSLPGGLKCSALTSSWYRR